MKVACQWGDIIPVGIISRNDRPPFEGHFAALSQDLLFGGDVDRVMLEEVVEGFG